jgi:hypothetical protein
MGEMIDRVAKAIYDAMDIADGLNMTAAETYASAAIAAMREPTSQMISASAKCNVEPEMFLHKQRWQAMIDEALR